MEENKPLQPRRVIGLAQKREEITTILAECYSRDLFELDEYERRIGLVHRSSTLDELEPLVSDVPAELLNSLKNKAPASPPAGEGRQLNVNHGVQKIDDQRLAVRQLNIKLLGGVLKLKYTSIVDLPGEIVINADVERSVLKIVVPPEFSVSEEMENTMLVIRYKRNRRWSRVPVTGRIRIAGSARHSVVKIKTRRRRW